MITSNVLLSITGPANTEQDELITIGVDADISATGITLAHNQHVEVCSQDSMSAYTTRVDLHTPKMLIIQFHTTKIIITQFHTSSVWRKCLSYSFHTFSKNNRKKINHFCGFLRIVEQTRLVTNKLI